MDLVSALESAANADPSQRQAGEKQLQSLEKSPEFNLGLLDLVVSPDVPGPSRYLAIIYFKNKIDRKWRRFENLDEKTAIRARLLQLLVSPLVVSSSQMVKQVSITIASIGRADFPRLWPQLLNELNTSVIESANQGHVAVLASLLEAVHQTLKKLGTARIGQARVLLNEFCVSQLELYWQLFTTFKLYAALKIVGTLLYDGHDRVHRFEGPRRVFSGLISVLQSDQGNEKFVRRIGKIYERLVSKNPLAFCGFRESAMQATAFYCDFLISRPKFAEEDRPGPILQSMRITLDLTRLSKWRDRNESMLPLNLRPRDDADRADLETAHQLVASVFTEERITSIVEALVQYYFQMTPADVELWKDDPAEFVVEEARQNPDFSVVLCSEMLFAHLLRAWPGLVAPKAQSLIEQTVQSGDELKAEAGLRALEFGGTTFSESFEIAPIVQLVGQSTSPLIRRRLCLVVGGWIPVRSDSLPQLAFELARSTLEAEWDIVVQLGALELVRICCDDIDFQPQQFEIAAERVFTTAYTLLQTPSQSTEVKIQVLKVLGTIIEGLNVHLSAADVARVLEILPSLWATETEHSNHHLVQGAVLQTLAHVISAVGVSSVSLARCFEVAIPLVDIATDPAQPVSHYLIEDGLEVWKSLLVNAPQDSTPMMAPLFERLLLLLEEKTEYLGLGLAILESFLWLDYRLAVPHYAKLFGLFSLYLNDGCALDEALLILLCTEVIMMMAAKTGHAAGGNEGGSLEAQAMQQTGMQQWLEHCIMRASSEDAAMDVMIQASKSINVLSLLSLQTAGAGIMESQTLFAPWLAKLRGILDPRDRKLGAMGLSALLIAHPDLYAPHAAQYVDVMGAIVEEIPDTAGFTEFYHSPENDQKSAEELRQQATRNEELAVRLGLQTFIKQVAEHSQQLGRPELYAMAAQMGIISS